MAWYEKIRQTALIKKKRDNKQRKKKRRDTTFNTAGFTGRYYKKSFIKRARDFPIFECLINSKWQEQLLPHILLSRKQPNDRLVFGAFIVDLFCLGLKNTFCNADISLEDYEGSLKAQMYQETSYINCHPNLAHQIIYMAIDYAGRLGFKPQKDFALSKFILDEPSEVDLSFDTRLGWDGKSCYVSDPADVLNYMYEKTIKEGRGRELRK